MATLENLQAKIAKLQAQAEAISKNQSSTVIAKIRDLMEKHGLTIADIAAHKSGRKPGRKPAEVKAASKSPRAAKYVDPKTGATWTGHGRAPAWIANAKDRSKFLIEGSADRTATAAKKVGKAGNYLRGPQTPKYRDPKTGATWSGRGPAPAWLANAKDRAAFLIAGAGEGAAEQKVMAAKKVATRKVAAKNAAVKKAAAKKLAAKKVAPAKNSAAVKKSPAEKAAVKKPVAKRATVAAKALTQASLLANGAAGESTAA